MATPAGFRRARGAASYRRGMTGEAQAEAALTLDGWTILARRLRTAAGEIDLVAERGGLLAFVEVKVRPTLAEAAHAIGPRQWRRLARAAEIVLADNPGWGAAGVRFDALLVDAAGQVRRVIDAYRVE